MLSSPKPHLRVSRKQDQSGYIFQAVFEWNACDHFPSNQWMPSTTHLRCQEAEDEAAKAPDSPLKSEPRGWGEVDASNIKQYYQSWSPSQIYQVEFLCAITWH